MDLDSTQKSWGYVYGMNAETTTEPFLPGVWKSGCG